MIVGQTYPHFVKRPAKKNMRRQFQRGNIVRIHGKTYRVVKIVDQPNTKRRQFQRQPSKQKKQQVPGKKQHLQQRRQQQLWNNDNTN